MLLPLNEKLIIIKKNLYDKKSKDNSSNESEEITSLKNQISELEKTKKEILQEQERINVSIKAIGSDNEKARARLDELTLKNKKQQQSEVTNNFVTFSPEEKELLEKHKDFFEKNSKIMQLFGADGISVAEKSVIVKAKTPKEELEIILNLACKLKGEPMLELAKINKLVKLCDFEGMLIRHAIDLIGAHADGNIDKPIHNFFEIMEFPAVENRSKKEWYKLCLESKLAMQLLLPEAANLINVPKNYDQGLIELAKIKFPKSKEIDKLTDSNLSTNITKEKLWEFSKTCVEANATLKNSKAIDQDDFAKAFKILTDKNLKTTDNLPGVKIDGKNLGEGFEKYYMVKLPAGDPRGLILGKLTNCCQSLGQNGAAVAEHGTKDKNSGFYVIFEKGPKGEMNPEKDKMIAQSFGWLGKDTTKGGKTLVLDSWERLGKENDKLMDPFYSAFANAVAEQGISRVTLGVGTNKQITTPFMRDVVVPTKFEGKHPYPPDSENQVFIIDKEQGITTTDLIAELFRNGIADKDTKEEKIIEVLNKHKDKLDNTINKKLIGGDTILHTALKYEHMGTLEKLVQKGADINAKNRVDDTVLRIAIEFCSIDEIEMLINNGADVNIKNRGQTPLCIAVQCGIDEAEILIKNGADVNAQENYGYTALHYAAEKGKVDIVEMLIQNGSDATIKNNEGKTAIDMAKTPKIKQILTNYKEKYDVQQKDMDTKLESRLTKLLKGDLIGKEKEKLEKYINVESIQKEEKHKTKDVKEAVKDIMQEIKLDKKYGQKLQHKVKKHENQKSSGQVL